MYGLPLIKTQRKSIRRLCYNDLQILKQEGKGLNNKGQTTVFLTLIISIMLLLILLLLEGSRIYMGRAKAGVAFQGGLSHVMADYQPVLFEQYHLLLLDKNYGGKGEGLLEEKLQLYLEGTLNGGDRQETSSPFFQYNIENIFLIDTTGVLDNDMAVFKKQIIQYIKMAGVKNRVEDLVKKIKDDQGESDVEKASLETQNVNENPTYERNENVNDTNQESKVQKPEDPRDTLKNILSNGLLNVVLPKGKTLSREKKEIQKIEKDKEAQNKKDDIDTSFADMQSLKTILKERKAEVNKNKFLQEAYGIEYAIQCFGNALEPKKDTVLECEVEYLIAGKDNDYDNVSKIVEKIIWMRFPMNYAYILKDEMKTEEAFIIASAICVATGTEGLTEVVKYLLLACWSYCEALSDVKDLLHGNKISYIKTKETWKTDIKNLSSMGSGKEDSAGLSYENYLMLLLAIDVNKEKKYTRMLELIQVNLQCFDSDFEIQNCVSEIQIQGTITLQPILPSGGDQSLYTLELSSRYGYE